MKLYATVQSERASKGQGGNKFLEVVMSIDKFEMVKIHLQEHNPETNTYHLTIAKDGQKQFLWAGYIKSKLETKGKSQKGEHKLIIKSLHDAMADCPCGWHFVSTGERSRAEIEEEFTKHL